MAEFVTMTGLKETVAALRGLPRELSGNRGGPVRAGLAAAARLIRDEARDQAPVKSGNLKKQIFMYRDREPGQGSEHYVVGVRTGRRSKRVRKLYRSNKLSSALRALSGGDAWYWGFVEFGTVKMAAHPFMRPAFEATKNRAVVEFEKVFRKGVATAVKRAKQGAGA